MSGGPVGNNPLSAEQARRVRLLVFDFDGVFTDNAVYVDETGRESVRCWRGDGLGLEKLRRLELPVLVLSTEVNPVVAARCRKLRLPCIQGQADKLAALREEAARRGVGLEAIAYAGNDANDAGCLGAVGLPVIVADAHPSVRHLARLVTTQSGGRGAVREICDWFAAALDPLSFPLSS